MTYSELEQIALESDCVLSCSEAGYEMLDESGEFHIFQDLDEVALFLSRGAR